MILGTAGHIDHGKSALVTALTGHAMDRLAEERRRGITIDLNFAPLGFEGLAKAGIVDVPGHEDFVRTMVAGASGIDLVLLVIDAAQGPQPQTWEHLAIVEQLRIPRGIPVITKADLADPEWIDLVSAEVMERLNRSPVAFEAPAIVSAVTGQGIPELSARLKEHVAGFGRAEVQDGFRMPIDRAFSIAGVGTVVTGTPWSGTLHAGDTISILPAGITGRVRSLEAYGAPVTEGGPGVRTAVGLAGVERSAVVRGDVLTGTGVPWRASSALDAQIELLPSAPPLQRRLRVRVHLGTAEVLGRLYPRGEILPGTTGLGRIALERPIVARGNDRFVLRGFSPVITIGGGRVLDPLSPRRAPWPDGFASEEPAPRTRALIVRRPAGVLAQDLCLLTGLPDAASRLVAGGLKEISLVGDRYIARSVTTGLRETALARVGEFHLREPAHRGLSLETLRKGLRGVPEVTSAVLEGLIRRGELVPFEGTVALPGFTARLGAGEEVLTRALAILDAAGLEPPTVSELEHQLGTDALLPALRFAAREGRLVAVESDRYFSPSSLTHLRGVLRELGQQQPVTPSMVRERLGLSRKYLIPLLEWADRTGITRRVGDARVLI